MRSVRIQAKRVYDMVCGRDHRASPGRPKALGPPGEAARSAASGGSHILAMRYPDSTKNRKTP